MSDRFQIDESRRPFAELQVDDDSTASGLHEPLHVPFGRAAVDKMTDVIGTPLHKFSPIFGNPYNNGLELRTILGNGYFLVLAVAAILGGWAVKDTHGLAVPPVLWLTLAIMALGILDAFSGLVATFVFTMGVIFSGHLFSQYWVTGPPGTQGMLYAFTGLLTMGFMWFLGPQLPRRVRLLGFNAIKNDFQRRYIIAGDFFVVTLLMILILGSVPIFVPIFTGANPQSLTQVTIQDHLFVIKVVVAIASFIRVGLDVIVHINFQPLTKTVGRHRSLITYWVLRIIASLIVGALVWELLGTVWQWPVIWALLISMDALTSLGERLLKPSSAYRFVPRNLFRIVTLLLFTELAARWLTGKIVTGYELLAWLVLLLVSVIGVYSFLDGPEDENAGERRATWVTRVLGIIVVIVLFVLSQGLWHIPATPYSNPSAVTVSSNGALYIADSGNNRVIQVQTNGHRAKFGTGLSNPSGVAPNPNSSASIYVADTNNNRVLRVSLAPTSAIAPKGAASHVALADAATTQVSVGGNFSHPTGLSTDAQGALFVADTGNNRVEEITTSGSQFTFATGLSGPLAVEADPFGHLYVANTGLGQIIRYDVSSTGHASNPKIVVAGLSRPAGVTADAQGNFYVSDSGNNKVVEYEPNGTHHDVAGTYNDPRGLSVDGAGHLYIADAGSGQVILSEPVYTGTTANVGPSKVATASARASDGTFYVVNAAAGTLEHVTSTGSTVLARNLNQPNGVAWSALGRLYVAQTGNGTIAQVDTTSGSLTVIASGLTGVTSISPDSYGGLWAVESAQGTLLAVSPSGKVQSLVTGLATPTSVVQDAYGHIDVTLQGTKADSGALWRITLGGKAEVLATGLSNPGGLSADGRGNVFFIESGAQRIWEDRGLLGAQIVWEGTNLATDPSSVNSDQAGNLTMFPLAPDRTIHITYSTTTYFI